MWLLRSHTIVYIVLCLATLYLVQNFIFLVNILLIKSLKCFPFKFFFHNKSFHKICDTKTDRHYTTSETNLRLSNLRILIEPQVLDIITISCSQYKNRKHILHLSASCSFSCFPIRKKKLLYERTVQ